METSNNYLSDRDDCNLGETCHKHPPRWFKLGEPLIWPTLGLAYQKLSGRRTGNMHLDMMAECAAIHLSHCMEASIETNRKGRHAVAISLVRQCVESMTIVELGLQDSSFRDPLLESWENETKSQGALRMALERAIWPRYGPGLWNETWGKFFGEFARAVQPYAHYSQLLQGWQLASAFGNELRPSSDGNYQFIVQIGVNTYDGFKATRITLLHCLITWTMGRILIANGGDSRIDPHRIQELGAELAKSELLGRGALEWHQEFWPHMFDKPK